MGKKIRLDIVTPERIVHSSDIDMLIARTSAGDIGILPGHAPLVGDVIVWPVRLITDGVEQQISVSGGFIEVLPEKITLLANIAELPEEIDIDRAMRAKERAEARLKKAEDIDVERAQLALARALMRLRVGQSKKGI